MREEATGASGGGGKHLCHSLLQNNSLLYYVLTRKYQLPDVSHHPTPSHGRVTCIGNHFLGSILRRHLLEEFVF